MKSKRARLRRASFFAFVGCCCLGCHPLCCVATLFYSVHAFHFLLSLFSFIFILLQFLYARLCCVGKFRKSSGCARTEPRVCQPICGRQNCSEFFFCVMHFRILVELWLTYIHPICVLIAYMCTHKWIDVGTFSSLIPVKRWSYPMRMNPNLWMNLTILYLTWGRKAFFKWMLTFTIMFFVSNWAPVDFSVNISRLLIQTWHVKYLDKRRLYCKVNVF